MYFNKTVNFVKIVHNLVGNINLVRKIKISIILSIVARIVIRRCY